MRNSSAAETVEVREVLLVRRRLHDRPHCAVESTSGAREVLLERRRLHDRACCAAPSEAREYTSKKDTPS